MRDTIKHDTHDALDRLRASLPEGQLSIVSVMERVRGEYLPGGFDDDLRRAFDALLRTVVTRHAVPDTQLGAVERRETRAMVVRRARCPATCRAFSPRPSSALRPVVPSTGGTVTLWGGPVPWRPLSVAVYDRYVLSRFPWQRHDVPLADL